MFEAIIKSAKRAIGAALRDASCTDKELHTTIVEAEGLLKSCPLTTNTSEADDLTPLTPNHVLIGRNVLPIALNIEADAAARVHPEKRWTVI